MASPSAKPPPAADAADAKPPTAADAEPPPAAEEDKVEVAKRQQVVRAILFSGFLSVCQHVMTLQSEPMLMKTLYGGDVSRSARALANSQGVVGLLALVFNQFGGKLSDAIGRKPGLLVGPVGNVLLGTMVFAKPGSKFTVIFQRIVRMVITTFSNTVMSMAAFADILNGPELAAVGGKIAAITGLGIVVAPYMEALVLKRSGNPKFSYFFMAFLGALQALTTMFFIPETLPAEKRISVDNALNAKSLNPFGFVKVYTHGSSSLRKLVSMSSMQFFAEGKNLSDYAMQWWVNHLSWSTENIRDFVAAYGISCMVGSVVLIPRLVRTLSPRGFTMVTDASCMLNYFFKGTSGPSSLAYIVSSFIGLPGVNAANGIVLRAISTERAVQEGFGKGEFSAWINNLRAVISGIAPVLYGNLYASVKESLPASPYLVAGVLSAVIPEVMLWNTSDAELQMST